MRTVPPGGDAAVARRRRSARHRDLAVGAGGRCVPQQRGAGAGHVAELLADSGGPVAGGAVGGLTATPIPSTVPNAVAVTIEG